MRFFLGCVPFGCDNIGDEAILASIVKIIRRNFVDAQICVSTATPEATAKLLGVETVGLYGFKKDISLLEKEDAFINADVFIWSGATGLSDYPNMALDILSLAQKRGIKTVLFGVGMDSKFNPAFFKLAGKKLRLCKLLTKISLGLLDFTELAENYLVNAVRNRLTGVLKKCDLVILRDAQSLEAFKKCPEGVETHVGVDSATILDEPSDSDLPQMPEEARAWLLDEGLEKIGVCISAQREVSDMSALANALDSLLESPKRRMFFIPMNPVTDSLLMKKMSAAFKNKSKTYLVENCLEPEHVIALASHCSAVLSSRLHLLILSANVRTPIIGISRGSKVDNFLAKFGLKASGSVDNCDFSLMKGQIEGLISNPDEFKQKRDSVYARLKLDMQNAERLLRETLTAKK